MPRMLTPRESEVLRAMLVYAGEIEGRPVEEGLRAKTLAGLSAVCVWGRCGCGTCPSIELGDPEQAAPMLGERWVLSAAVPGAGLLLFIDGGQLSYLELYPLEKDGAFEEFPPVPEMSF